MPQTFQKLYKFNDYDYVTIRHSVENINVCCENKKVTNKTLVQTFSWTPTTEVISWYKCANIGTGSYDDIPDADANELEVRKAIQRLKCGTLAGVNGHSLKCSRQQTMK